MSSLEAMTVIRALKNLNKNLDSCRNFNNKCPYEQSPKGGGDKNPKELDYDTAQIYYDIK